MFADLSLREKIMIFIGILILIVALYYFYFYSPLANEIDGLESTLKQKESNIATLEKSIEDMPELQAKYDELTEKVSKIDNKIDEENKKEYETKTTDILKFFNDITEETKVTMRSFRPLEDEEKVEIIFSHRGDFYEIISFFDKVDQFQTDISYNHLNLNRQGDILNSDIKLVFPKGDDKNE